MIRKWFVFVLFFFISCSVFSAAYSIIDYNFFISGKTMDGAIERLIVPNSVEVFDSEDSLITALITKKQTLINQRIFKSIDYFYTLGEPIDEVIPVTVSFEIEDARSFLVLPYPKYDSNYGTRLGVKLWDSNLFGTLSNLSGTLHATFEDNNWSNPIYFGNIELAGLYIGETSISLSVLAEGRFGEKLYDYAVSTSFVNIPLLFNSFLNLDFSGKKSGEGTKYSVSSSLGGIKIGSIGFTPSFNGVHYDKDPESSYYIPSLNIDGIDLRNVGISFFDSVKLIPTAESGYKKIASDYISHVTNLSFNGDFLRGVNYTNEMIYYPMADENGADFYFNNTASYKLTDVSTIYIMENIATSTDSKTISYFDTGLGVSQKIDIGSKVLITPKLSEYLRVYPTNHGLEYARYYTIEASTSGDYVNWIGNFRDGIQYTATISEAWMQRYNLRESFAEKDGVFDHVEISAYKLLWGWLNPSARIIFNYAVDRDDYKYLYGSTSATVGEELRGIRNYQVEDENMLAFIANINLMTYFPLPSFLNFVDTYANIFFDYALLKKDLATPAKNYYGVGFEGIGVLKDYPSYPIRISVGFDLEGLIKCIKNGGPKGFYEIYFGMGFFF